MVIDLEKEEGAGTASLRLEEMREQRKKTGDGERTNLSAGLNEDGILQVSS